MLKAKAGAEELAWVTREEKGERCMAAASKVAAEQSERCWKVWVRVCLGGERRIDVARSLGYKDGSAITQILKRLENKLPHQPAFTERISTLTEEFRTVCQVSRVDPYDQLPTS